MHWYRHFPALYYVHSLKVPPHFTTNTASVAYICSNQWFGAKTRDSWKYERLILPIANLASFIRTSNNRLSSPYPPPPQGFSELISKSLIINSPQWHPRTHHTVTMVELRKRKAPADTAPPAPPVKKANSVRSSTSSKKGDASANGSATTINRVAVGDIITIDGFGGQIETNDGQKVTLKRLLDESKSGVILFTYPRASTPSCRYSFSIYYLSICAPLLFGACLSGLWFFR